MKIANVILCVHVMVMITMPTDVSQSLEIRSVAFEAFRNVG